MEKGGSTAGIADDKYGISNFLLTICREKDLVEEKEKVIDDFEDDIEKVE
jgi:hypothetical protein